MNLITFKVLAPVSIIIISFIFFCETAYSQLLINAQYRPRFELRDGYQKLAGTGSTPAAFISQRTRLSIGFENENLKLIFSPQDVRLWGGDQNVSSTGVASNTTIGLFEGYAEIKLGNAGWISVGRQQLRYDNELLLAGRNWNQNGMSYDALLVKLKFSELNLHAGSSWNTLSEATSDNFYPPNRIKSYNFIWLNRKFVEKVNLSLLHIASGVAETDDSNKLYFRQTTGFYSDYSSDILHTWGNFYYQYGKNQLGTSISAYLIAADVSFRINKIKPGVGVSLLSGNEKTGAEQAKDNLFDRLYGARHRYFGFMDYFRSMPSHTNQGGLSDYYFYLEYKVSKSVNIKNIGHVFLLTKTNSGTPADNNLGYENDLIVRYKFSDWGVLETGYLFFLPTESLKIIQNIPDNKFSQFFYLQLTLTPVLFKQQNQLLQL